MVDAYGTSDAEKGTTRDEKGIGERDKGTSVSRQRIDPFDIYAQKAAQGLEKINPLLDDISEGTDSVEKSLRLLQESMEKLGQEIGEALRSGSTVSVILKNYIPDSLFDGIENVFGASMGDALRTLEPFVLDLSSMKLVSDGNQIPEISRAVSTILENARLPAFLAGIIKKLFPDNIVIHFKPRITGNLVTIKRSRLTIKDIEGIEIDNGPDPCGLDIAPGEPRFTLGTPVYNFDINPFEYFENDLNKAEKILDQIEDSLDDTLDEKNKPGFLKEYSSALDKFKLLQKKID
jgi:hypothetical protein